MNKFFDKEDFYFIGFFIIGVMTGGGSVFLFCAAHSVSHLTRRVETRGVETREANACIDKLKLMQNECMKANRKVE